MIRPSGLAFRFPRRASGCAATLTRFGRAIHAFLLPYGVGVLLAVAAGLGLAAAPAPARAAIITVESTADNVTVDGSCTLREAVTNANRPSSATPHPDCETGDGGALDEVDASKLPGTISLGSLGYMNVSEPLTFIGPGADLLAIDAHDDSRFFYVEAASDLTLKGVTLANGHTTGHGGAIYSASTLTLQDVHIVNAQSDNQGGGISVANANLSLIDSSVRGCTATTYGGGFVVDRGSVTLRNSAVSDNEANGDGGGMYVVNGSASLTNSTVSGNNASGDGFGGGFYVAGGNVTISNSTISANRAENYGIDLGQGGGFYLRDGSAIVQNSIVANNESAFPAFRIVGHGSSLALNYSLIEGYYVVDGTSSGANNLIGDDPGLSPLQDNGGSTLTQALLWDSPAIDAGDPAFSPSVLLGFVLAHDQRGAPFARVTDGRVDMGAVERQADVVSAGDPIFANGFEILTWYLDADADLYGDPAVFVQSGTQPAGYVDNPLDCNDSDAAIHPGVADEPDAAFTDNNCDGLDGDIAKAVFVAPTGTNQPACTPATPCRTPAYAITRLTAERTQVYLQVGTYPGSLIVGVDAQLYGGYDANWSRGPVVEGGSNAELIGTVEPMGSHGAQAFAAFVSPGVSASFADLVVSAPPATGLNGVTGLSSYAVYVDQAEVRIDRSVIKQGNGADGAPGLPGAGAQGSAGNGGNGGNANSTLACNDTDSGGGGYGGGAAFCGNPGGRGGDGGTAATDCAFFGGDNTATAGEDGLDAPYASTEGGTGGTGGQGSLICSGTGNGAAGVDGINGAGGFAGSGSRIGSGMWLAQLGGTGFVGTDGNGGGGGGGAGGCDIQTDSYGAGGGGGGAGGCAAPTPGSGGGGGGGSFGVFAVSSVVTVNFTTFYRGDGGDGGAGGAAAAGQAGGSGGNGGANQDDDEPGGDGGDGGRGGVAGAGAGGQGGIVYAIYSLQSSVDDYSNLYLGGTAGAGGAGGVPVSVDGSNVGAGFSGMDGTLGAIGTCTALESC